MIFVPEVVTPVANPEFVQPAGSAVPEIAKVIKPLGASALTLPVATAVNVMTPPRVGTDGETERATDGVPAATTVDGAELVTAPTAL